MTIGIENFLNGEKLLQSLHRWRDAAESMTHFGTVVAVVAERDDAVR